MLPLYQAAKLAKNLKDDAHRGLWWSRFFNKFGADFSKPDVGGKGEFITEICKGKCGDADVLSANALRQVGLFTALGGVHSCYQTQGRFVTGMGNDHPTENGFTWHPTLAVPYLPASSVKGLVRGWIEWNGAAHAHQPDLKNWFGSQTKSEVSEQAGWFIFFDALPVAPVQLAADVMTPHYGKWYEQGDDLKKNMQADTVPADWHSPVPVTFLTVKNASFQFGIAVRGGLSPADKTIAQSNLRQVMAVLQDALEWAGAGAKTATGYGRMQITSKYKKLEDEANLATKPVENRFVSEIDGLTENKLIELFSKDLNKTRSDKGEHFELFSGLVKKQFSDQIDAWASVSKKSDKNRYKAYRFFSGSQEIE